MLPESPISTAPFASGWDHCSHFPKDIIVFIIYAMVGCSMGPQMALAVILVSLLFSADPLELSLLSKKGLPDILSFQCAAPL